ncbi:hypothetical protein MTO96_036051, partial [Rhipicephalus appendiculatus]
YANAEDTTDANTSPSEEQPLQGATGSQQEITVGEPQQDWSDDAKLVTIVLCLLCLLPLIYYMFYITYTIIREDTVTFPDEDTSYDKGVQAPKADPRPSTTPKGRETEASSTMHKRRRSTTASSLRSSETVVPSASTASRYYASACHDREE